MSAFEVRGVVEGFYGAAYTQPEREGLLRFLGQLGYDTYYYGPKNDRQHRARWREPYGPRALEGFGRSVEAARAAGVEFVYTLSPGLDIRYSSAEDFAAVREKFASLMALGVRSFGLFLDDINPTFKHAEDSERFPSFAVAQAELCNRVLGWLRQRRADAALVMCPTAYHGAPPFGDYLHELGACLSPEVNVFYTGTEVCSPTITGREVEAFAQALRRRPLIWDNYPVNDGGMSSELHLEPIRGRGPELVASAKGFAVNPMNQVEASKVTLHTFAAYLSDPARYDPEAAWQEALAAVAGEEHAPALEALARTCRHGVLAPEPAPELARLAAAAHAALGRPGRAVADDPALVALREHLVHLDEACYALKFHLCNYALRAEVLPWVEALESWLWSGIRALEIVAAAESGDDVTVPLKRLKEPYATARAHHKRSGGEELEPFITRALEAYAGVPA